MECTTSVLCGCISSSHSLLSSCAVSAAVKMDASQRREEPCSVPIASHCRKLIITLPSKKKKKNHSRPCLPLSHHSPKSKSAPSLSPRSSPSQHDRQAQLTVPVSGGKKAEHRGKMTGPQMTGVVKIVRRRKA